MTGHGVAFCPRCETPMEYYWGNRDGYHYKCRNCINGGARRRDYILTFKPIPYIDLDLPVITTRMNGFKAEM